MSEPGKSVSRTIGEHFKESYRYPDNVCWIPEGGKFISRDEAEKLSAEAAAKAAKAVKEKLLDIPDLDIEESDLHGDGATDRYRLVKIDKHYLVFLSNGYTYTNTYAEDENLQFSSQAVSQQSQLIGIIPKEEKILQVQQIIARPSDENENVYDLVVQGFAIFMGKSEPAEWRFKQVACQ